MKKREFIDWLRETELIHHAPRLKKAMVISLLIFISITMIVILNLAQNIDYMIVLGLSYARSPLLNKIMIDLTYMGSYTVMWLLMIPCVIYFFKKKRIDLAATQAVFLIGSDPLIFLVKEAVQRQRPYAISLYSVSGYSFPSGHALASTCFYFGAFFLISLLPENHERRNLLITIGFSFAVLISFTRLYLGVHYLSDVAAGIALGLVWVGFVILFLNNVLVRSSKTVRSVSI